MDCGLGECGCALGGVCQHPDALHLANNCPEPCVCIEGYFGKKCSYPLVDLSPGWVPFNYIAGALYCLVAVSTTLFFLRSIVKGSSAKKPIIWRSVWILMTVAAVLRAVMYLSQGPTSLKRGLAVYSLFWAFSNFYPFSLTVLYLLVVHMWLDTFSRMTNTGDSQAELDAWSRKRKWIFVMIVSLYGAAFFAMCVFVGVQPDQVQLGSAVVSIIFAVVTVAVCIGFCVVGVPLGLRLRVFMKNTSDKRARRNVIIVVSLTIASVVIFFLGFCLAIVALVVLLEISTSVITPETPGKSIAYLVFDVIAVVVSILASVSLILVVGLQFDVPPGAGKHAGDKSSMRSTRRQSGRSSVGSTRGRGNSDVMSGAEVSPR